MGRAIRLGVDQITKVIFHSDASSLVRALSSNDHDRSVISVLVKEAKRQCMLDFDNFRRRSSSPAHELARLLSFGSLVRLGDFC